MTLKSIDLQLSVTKSMDLAQMQNQLTQKPVSDQASLASAALKKAEEDRQKSTQLEQADQVTIGDDEQSNQASYQQRYKKNKSKQPASEPNDVKHPYKGKHIDYSL